MELHSLLAQPHFWGLYFEHQFFYEWDRFLFADSTYLSHKGIEESANSPLKSNILRYQRKTMPMDWNCEKDGCHLQQTAPNWEGFNNALEGKNEIGDIDGVMEKHGYLMFIEWKREFVKDAQTGQKIMYENATKRDRRLIFLLVNGTIYPEQNVTRIRVYVHGKLERDIQNATNETLFDYIQKWEQRIIKEHKNKVGKTT